MGSPNSPSKGEGNFYHQLGMNGIGHNCRAI